ncbi:MAG: 4'-phosphopantetheinyl transferase family protein [Candidatus Coproplasma sp.]
MFKLLYTDVSSLTDCEFERLCKILPTERLTKVTALKDKKQRYLSAGAGYLLHIGLSDLGLINPRIYRNEHGKPYLKEGSIFFNLSHSGTVAVCAISSAEVGIDVQEVRPVSESLIKKICTKDEYAFVAQNSEEIDKRFCRLWAIKESVIKCLGKGLSLSPSKIEVKLSTPHSIIIGGEQTNLRFKEYTLNGYYIAVCSSVDNFSPEVNKIAI